MITTETSVVSITNEEYVVEFRLYHEESGASTFVQVRVPVNDNNTGPDYTNIISTALDTISSEIQAFETQCQSPDPA